MWLLTATAYAFTPTHVAPLYFGPNAFVVPEMLDGRVHRELHVSLAGEYFMGSAYANSTEDLSARLYIPLFTDRVNLSVWMPVMEWWQDWKADGADVANGHDAGDVYISTDIEIFRERQYVPGFALRAAVKTASGGHFEQRRFYDAPGYFFDLSTGKSFTLNRKSVEAGKEPLSLRLAASVGFLCWQTGDGRQNDAVMYGASLALEHTYFYLRETYSGYSGWEKDGDRPMILKTRVAGRAKGFEPFFEYEYGLRDYPYHHFALGLAYNVDILKSKKKND